MVYGGGSAVPAQQPAQRHPAAPGPYPADKRFVVQAHGPRAVVQLLPERGVQVAGQPAVNRRLGHHHPAGVVEPFLRVQHRLRLAVARHPDEGHPAAVVGAGDVPHLPEGEAVVVNGHAVARPHPHVTLHAVILAEGDAGNRHRQPEVRRHHSPVAERGFRAAGHALVYGFRPPPAPQSSRPSPSPPPSWR